MPASCGLRAAPQVKPLVDGPLGQPPGMSGRVDEVVGAEQGDEATARLAGHPVRGRGGNHASESGGRSPFLA